MKRYLFTNFVLLLLLVSCAGWREQWTPIPDGEDLIGGDIWQCKSGIKVIDNTLIAEDTGDIFTTANASGPHFQIQGDFGVSTTIEVTTNAMAAVSLFGRLRDGGSWWEGISRIDLGLEAGQVAVDIMSGTGFMPSVSERFPAEDLSGPVELALRKIGDEFVVRANGEEVGRLADPGVFPDNTVYLGITVYPGNILTVYDLSIETERGQVGNVQMIAPSPAAIPHYTPSEPPLRALADEKDLFIGAAVGANQIRCDRAYAEALGHEFNMLTTENAMKFTQIHPARDRYTFDAADTIVEYALAHDMQVRGHTLIWYQSEPVWLVIDNWTREEAIEILHDHITTVVGRYRGRVAIWDVLNEGIGSDNQLRDTIWLNAIGPEYIELAFRWAHEADPDALLFYNDYNAEAMGSKSDAIYALVKDLLERGVPIHGVGLQMHTDVNETLPSQSILENIERLSALGLQVHITELDVRIPGENPSDRLLAKQADVYRETLEVCLEAENCTAFVMWGFTDRYSWIPMFQPGYGSALIFDKAYQPKPAYEALHSVLSEP